MFPHHSDQISQNLKFFQTSENLPKIGEKNSSKICLIKCLKGHKSLGSLCSVVKTLIVSLVRASKQGTRSPIELLWTAKKFENFGKSSGFGKLFMFGKNFHVFGKFSEVVRYVGR